MTFDAETRVLDIGCGNGVYLAALAARGVIATGCDLSIGMLRATPGSPKRTNADICALPFPDSSFDIILAPHMLYHVEDRVQAVRELRRVLAPRGTCIAITNGFAHTRHLRTLVCEAAHFTDPTWEMRNPSVHAFGLENGEQQMRVAFDRVEIARPEDVAPVVLTDAAVAADYVASVEDHYAHEVSCPWASIVETVRTSVQQVIDTEGSFIDYGEVGAFICS